MKDISPSRVLVGAFELDVKAGELRQGTQTIRLQKKPCQVLLILVEHGGEVVTREEIQKRLWPNDTVVDFEHGINTAIKKLRAAFEDSADGPRYIETLARRGYRLMVPVEWLDAAEKRSSAVDEAALKLHEELQPSPQGESPALSRTTPAPSESSALIGRKVSHYRVLAVIGGGGMGVVYRAEDVKLGRAVALKFLPEELGGDSRALERFEREARAASALDHPNICSIYEFGEHEGQPFLAMQLLQGQTLRDRLTAAQEPGEGERALPLSELLDIAIQIARGLEAAHEKGIVHRDIKPANIFITTKGVAKILDFGVAKLTSLGENAADDPPCLNFTAGPSIALGFPGDGESGTAGGAAPAAIERTLTRTGIALGTAGYMSPEQVRGEKLDARTDLFSFGLVLYEMATGQRAFTGETSAILHDAILHQTPIAVHDLNSTLPPGLARIINKAIEKDRERRYQSAENMRAELKSVEGPSLKNGKNSKGYRLLRYVATFVFVTFLLAAAVVFVRKFPQISPRTDLKDTQLTANSSESGVESGAISPDGRNLAYCDDQGMHIKLLESGEVKEIPAPEALSGVQVSWRVLQLSNTKFLADARVLGRGSSVWTVSVLGGVPHKLRDDAEATSASPDGALIAFMRNKGTIGYREIWVMDSSGLEARKLFETDANSDFQSIRWSPDGRRLVYRKDYAVGSKLETTVESRELNGGRPTIILSNPMVWTFAWLPGGRFIYSLLVREINVANCNLWELRVDPQNGQPSGKPVRLTNWSGFCIAHPSTTTDGKKLVFNKFWTERSVYVADFPVNDKRRLNPSRLTLNDGQESPVGWTADGKAVVFTSNSTGKFGLWKQSPGDRQAQSIVTGFNGSIRGRMSPRRDWILFNCCPDALRWESMSLMRVRADGGPAETVFPLISSPEPLSPFAVRYVQPPRCTQPPADLCAIAERRSGGKQLVFTSFDPVKGRGRELASYGIDPTASYKWDLSPDGTRIAVLKVSDEHLHILSLANEGVSEITIKKWNTLETVDWSVDGKGLFVSAPMNGHSTLLYTDLQGNARVLWDQASEQEGDTDIYAIPSPDGHRLAMYGWKINSNMWMLENF